MRKLICSIAFLSSIALSAQNAYLTNCFVPRYWKANTGWEIAARVRNSQSGAPLISFRVDYRFGNGPVQQGDWQSTTGINPGQYWPYVHQIPFTSPSADGTLKVWVVGIGETDPANDTLSFPLTVIPQWATKSVLMEQFTGTWCQFCPTPNATTNALDADPLIVVAKHHNADEFSVQSSTDYWAQFSANYSPSGVMDQEEFGRLQDDAAYDQWGARADLRKLGVSPVAVSAMPAFNTWTRMLAMDVIADFKAAVSGQFVLNAYVVEDQVPGPQTAGAPGYLHQQVVRAVLGGPTGVAGVIPSTTVANTIYSEQFALQVPQEWNHTNLRVIATVSERSAAGTWTMNVSDNALIEVGVGEEPGLRFGLFPNPARDAVRLRLPSDSPARVRLFAADGRMAYDSSVVPIGGLALIERPASTEPGLFLIRVDQDGRTGMERLMLD
ncbi:MAG: Omp28-related outer membrane protein [Flavobacteriales bacterium]|nr:Omp28-related outer membrane protein [Flavobacteriales bacterium]